MTALCAGGEWRVFPCAPFLGELRIDPFTEPGFWGSPAQPFGKQHVINPTALAGNLFLLVEIGGQPIECPTRKRLVEVARISQGSGYDFRHLFW
jgi:hypothetical protein